MAPCWAPIVEDIIHRLLSNQQVEEQVTFGQFPYDVQLGSLGYLNRLDIGFLRFKREQGAIFYYFIGILWENGNTGANLKYFQC